MRSRLLVLAGVVILASCLNEKEYDFREITVTPTIAFPIAFGDLGLVNLLSDKDSSFVRAYPDGLLYFYYTQTLGSTDVRDLFVLPDNTSTSSFALTAGMLPASSINVAVGTINRQLDLGLSPEQLTEILFKGGMLNYSVGISKVTSPPNLPVEATITLTDVVHKTTLVPLSFTVGNGSGSKLLKDYVMRLSNDRFNIQVDLVIKPHPATFIPVSTSAQVELIFAGMEFAHIKGFLGDQITQLPPQSIEISVFGSSLKGAGIAFVEPKLSLNVVNDYGAPCEVNFSVLRASKGSTMLPFQISPANPVNLNSPTILGESATTNVSILNQAAILNLGPEILEYTASARINKGLSNASNFLADTSKLRITLTTEIPIYGRVSGVTIYDTLRVDLSDVNQSKVNSSSLKISGRNEMPLDANVQIYLADSTYLVQDSLFLPNQTYIVKSSTVDAAGDLVSAGASESVIGLEPARLGKLFSSKFLIIKSTMSTARDQNNTPLNVKFRSSYRLKLNVGLLATFNIRLK